jgi:hypothetical protein
MSKTIIKDTKAEDLVRKFHAIRVSFLNEGLEPPTALEFDARTAEKLAHICSQAEWLVDNSIRKQLPSFPVEPFTICGIEIRAKGN